MGNARWHFCHGRVRSSTTVPLTWVACSKRDVNLAARLMSVAGRDSVLVSASVRRKVQALFD
jgi:hypothetical protein